MDDLESTVELEVLLCVVHHHSLTLDLLHRLDPAPLQWLAPGLRNLVVGEAALGGGNLFCVAVQLVGSVVCFMPCFGDSICVVTMSLINTW